MLGQPIPRGRGQLGRRAAGTAAEVGQEMPGQEENVVAALAQRRQVDRHDVQPEVQVLAKSLLADHLGQVLVRRCQHAGIAGDRQRTAHADHHFLFQHSQQLGLAIEAQVADLVEKKCAARGQFELAGTGLAGIGEGAFLVPEKFAFRQRFGNRARSSRR